MTPGKFVYIMKPLVFLHSGHTFSNMFGVPVRVQRSQESVAEAAAALFAAGRTKHAAMMVLVVMHRREGLPFTSDLPPGVVVVESPALLIQAALGRVQLG